MLLNMMLPWFPIVLSAAIGARLIGPAKASWLGVTCALFWVIVVQTTSGVPFWSDPATFASLLAGSAAIVGMAHWSGVYESSGSTPDGAVGQTHRLQSVGLEGNGSLDAVSNAITEFDDWLERHRFSTDAWPAFDEFLRNLLYRHCGATHTRPYRILSEGDSLVPLRAIESTDPEELPSARKGILGHVATTGRPFYATDESQGELVLALAANTKNPPVWCFAVRQGARSIGLVSVGQLADCGTGPLDPMGQGQGLQSVGSGGPASRALMRTFERLTGQFWTTLREVCRGRCAAKTDAVSGMMTREAFLDEARRAASQSYAHGEPVAIAVIAVEGLRTLLDQGKWDLADDVVSEVSAALRDRLRPDDLLGRFDDARFLLMLRRVDSELASLIATQLVERLAQLLTVNQAPARDPMGLGAGLQSLRSGDIGIRCGVSGSGTGSPSVTQLVAEAVALSQRAREKETLVVSDLPSEPRPFSEPRPEPEGSRMTPPNPPADGRPCASLESNR